MSLGNCFKKFFIVFKLDYFTVLVLSRRDVLKSVLNIFFLKGEN